MRRARRSGSSAQGFTLVELMVVFALLAMLLTIALPRYLGSTDRAREKAREQNMEVLRDAIDKFKGDQGRYPTDLSELVQRQYLRRVPIDPVSGSVSWTLIASPTGETGVFDIAIPAQAAASTPVAQEPAQ
ncbi:prepilin-type N-terminal cleavage/methylation domain-containing protein [Ramlibacter sp. G-1-2-2]|uniref:Prepilin-type N-terminal cleavage/methylation domain-containing protein n=2 Tax=Ramlibacter agri TaxID=2728837 RepID=A0A848GXT2_9BURK|nr:prepilin-type N-terminal cleavage/methylation domain-containing protein [Ramlibacter agri]NML43476.1 prepilin-type N-terminal cleavage/methylation domain-containing protein [Ramlibacter agri]